jgi:hypothetical protein
MSIFFIWNYLLFHWTYQLPQKHRGTFANYHQDIAKLCILIFKYNIHLLSIIYYQYFFMHIFAILWSRIAKHQSIILESYNFIYHFIILQLKTQIINTFSFDNITFLIRLLTYMQYFSFFTYLENNLHTILYF